MSPLYINYLILLFFSLLDEEESTDSGQTNHGYNNNIN